MAKEVECKLMGMSIEGFIQLAKEKGVHVETPFSAKKVEDTYWDLPNVNLLRYRHITDGSLEWKDITIKGRELNGGDGISEREENILKVQYDAKVEKFLETIGATIKHTISKSRTWLHIYDSSFDVNVHHDKVLGTELQWIEVETNKSYKLEAFLDYFGIKETSNKSTLEILGLDL